LGDQVENLDLAPGQPLSGLPGRFRPAPGRRPVAGVRTGGAQLALDG